MARYSAEIGGRTVAVELSPSGKAIVDGQSCEFSHSWIDAEGKNLLLVLDGLSYDLRVEEEDGVLAITHAGNRYHCAVADERLARLRQRSDTVGRAGGRLIIKAPMPGLVVKTLVEPGVGVKQGDRLLVLEAMKMENDIRAPHDGRVSSVSVTAGQAVESGRELLVID
jgi:biotin carboxyl carrier protein